VQKTLLFVCFLTLGNLTLFAQTGKALRVAHSAEPSAAPVPLQEDPKALKTIYSNLGSSKTYLYDATQGAGLVTGPNSGAGFARFYALPFTPKNDSHVSQVQVAIQHYSGANQVNFSIYGDTNGAPGTLLAGPVTVTDLPPYDSCCVLDVGNFTPVAVSGGTQYWLVADTPLTGTGSDFDGLWANVAKPVIVMAINTPSNGEGWYAYNANGRAAAKVLGTIP